jgi:hypothetical protein
MLELLMGFALVAALVGAIYFFGILFGGIRMPLGLRNALSAAGVDVSRMPQEKSHD